MINDSYKCLPNGWRYPLGVGAWIRPRNGIPRKPEKGSKNAAHIPSLSKDRMHALLARVDYEFTNSITSRLKRSTASMETR
jgi:hypothetical protein